MRRSRSSLALLCGAFLLTFSTTGRPAVFGQAASSQKANEKSASATTAAALKPIELDLEGLKSLLRRDPKDARPLLINFWATWCEPCREEFPDLLKIKDDYRKRGLDFAAVSFDFAEEVERAVPDFLRQVKADIKPYWLNLPDPEPAIRMIDPTWTGGLPSTFLFDAQGKLVFKRTGRIRPAELRAAIDKVVTSDK
ncbi:MAG TPA: redoxin domain-containing protein [Pyrinomonadaceae bacterium]